MYSYQKLRKKHYSSSVIKFKKSAKIDISNWTKNPYTFLKARLFIEVASILVFFLQYTKVTPNSITGLYIFLGFLSGLFLASNNSTLILISLFLIVFKNVFDWSDGLLARIKNNSSSLGDVLDRWGSVVSYNSFIFGFGFYLFNENQDKFFLLITFAIIFLKSIDLKDYVYHLVGYKIIKENNVSKVLSLLNIKNKSHNINKNSKFEKFKRAVIMLMDDSRSHTIDPIVLIIFIDHFYKDLIFLPYIFYIIFFKNFLFFSGGVYITYFKNYVFKK
tara:strand:- start:1789 stop:2613 length:825 start_codon:yes stop_codon:yes gene_type:complete